MQVHFYRLAAASRRFAASVRGRVIFAGCAVAGCAFSPDARAGVTLEAAQAAIAPRTSLPVGKGTAFAGNEEASASAARAFDGSPATSWTAEVPSGKTEWLEYRFDDGVRWQIAEYSVTNGRGTGANDPQNWTLLGSNDGAEWRALDTRRDEIFTGKGKTRTCRPAASSGAYNRYRIEFGFKDAGDRRVEVAEIGLTVKALLPPPEQVTAEPERGQVLLAWTPVDSATGYTVRRSLGLRGPYAVRATGVRGASFADTGPFENGEVSYYTVSSDAEGGPQGVMSSPAGSPTPAAAPADVKIITGDGQVTLEWSPSPRAVAYTVRRALAKDGPYTVIGSQLTAPGFTDKGLGAGTAYHYTVCGVANGKEGVDSEPVTARFPPVRPTGLVTEAGKEMVTLKWNAVPLAKAYRVTRSDSSGGDPREVAVVAGDTVWTDKETAANTTYRYAVAAENDCGIGAASEPAEGKALRPAAWWRR